MQQHPAYIIPTDQNRYAISPANDAPTFESRNFAEAVLISTLSERTRESEAKNARTT